MSDRTDKNDVQKATITLSNDRNILEDNKKDLEELLVRSSIDNDSRDSKSRKWIAYIFSIAFILILGTIVIGGPVFNANVSEESKIDIIGLLESFCSHFGTPLGFVLGYYFKSKNS